MSIQFKSFILLVPGGGVEPPRSEDRRILSLFFKILQRVAGGCTISHKTFGLRVLRGGSILAVSRSKMHESRKRTAIKTATKLRGGFPILEQGFSRVLQQFGGSLVAVLRRKSLKNKELYLHTYQCNP
jgi:hypothetical protein